MTSICKSTKLILLSAVPLWLAACGGGGGGSSGSLATITVDGTKEAMDWVETSIPGCTPRPVPKHALNPEQVESVQAASLVSTAISRLADFREQTSAYGMADTRATSYAGECGGTMSYTFEHASGTDTYTINFNNYCMLDYNATPLRQNFVNGTVVAKNIGTPGDYGPTIHSGSLETSNLSVAGGGRTLQISLEAEHSYGVPATWSPGTPTQSNPDVTKIEDATFVFVEEGKEHRVKDMIFTTYESGTNTVVNVNSGDYILTSGNRVEVSTSQPVVVNSGGGVVSGTVDVVGAGGTIVQVSSASPGSSTLVVTVNGQPMDEQVDCSEWTWYLFGTVNN
jgi:hypothetical protein